MNSTPQWIFFSALWCLTGTGFADVVINEVNYNGEPNTALNEFVELFNTGPDTVDLTGWVIDDAVGYAFPDGTLLAAG